MPFSPGHFPLYGFQYDFTQGAFLLTGVASQPVMQLFGNVFNLDIGHASKIAAHSYASNILEGNYAGPRSVGHQSELIAPTLEIADLTILETTKSDTRLCQRASVPRRWVFVPLLGARPSRVRSDYYLLRL